ncbi:MAG: hypothetical protein FWF82_06110 [Oscillospiraceae bacterium]|nr:hypothetical protein [Oscillospiraceae bacterium]
MVKQVYIHVTNKPGRIYAVMETLATSGINTRSLFVADGGDTGIIRLIVNDPEKAVTALKSKNFVAETNSVIGFTVPDEPGGLCNVMRILGENDINVKYSYSLMNRGKGADIVIRVEDNDKAISVLEKAGVKLFSQEDIK